MNTPNTPDPSRKSYRLRRLWVSVAGLLAIVVAVVAVSLSAAGSSSALNKPSPSTPVTAAKSPAIKPAPEPAPSPAPTPKPAPTPAPKPQPSPANAVVAAINTFETKYGPAVGTWKITLVQKSTVDPDYVMFKIGPAPGNEATVQGGYGFVHRVDASWTVIGFGTLDVGCAPAGPTTPVVPTAVLDGFGVPCSS